jgi:hypothetical protein
VWLSSDGGSEVETLTTASALLAVDGWMFLNQRFAPLNGAIRSGSAPTTSALRTAAVAAVCLFACRCVRR